VLINIVEIIEQLTGPLDETAEFFWLINNTDIGFVQLNRGFKSLNATHARYHLKPLR
jgi:hypothetical protein